MEHLTAVNLSDLKNRTFYYRAHARSDWDIIRQIFEWSHYDLGNFALRENVEKFHAHLIEQGKKPLIIDAGANIGATLNWFAHAYAGSHIVAIEPAADNIQVLRKNSDGIDCTIYEGAIGSVNSTLTLQDIGYGEAGYRVVSSQDDQQNTTQVPVYSATEIVEHFTQQGMVPFIFKIDIEGSEAELFSQNLSWLSRFPLVILELHDWMLPRTSNSRNFLRAISALDDIDFVYRGENVFCFNYNLL
ncbi:MAG: FkbM family methyltransferase [Gammaproteobacteria bacterium]|nr:FkbM family methyltransferase [Gammaproteobacteria bacterium]